MYRLIYSSLAVPGLGSDGVNQILCHARAKTKRDGITGLILFHKGAFLQVLEGREDRVRQNFERAGLDPRHEQVTLLSQGATEVSLFDAWTVGHALPNHLPRDVAGQRMTLVKLRQWLESETRMQDVEEQDVIYTIRRFLDGLGEIDARLDVDFLQCYEVDRRQTARSDPRKFGTLGEQPIPFR